MLLGAIAMRGAGCVYNDIVDRDLDARVARTASRPVASGAVPVKAALAWTGLLALVGLVVLLQLSLPAQIVALASLALVAAYPFMKRITWWPQAWLGLVFSRSEEHTSELQSLMRISYAVFCLKKKDKQNETVRIHSTTDRRSNPTLRRHLQSP